MLPKVVGGELYHRIQTKHSITVSDFDRISYDINDPLSTSYYKIKDSVIGFWGISRSVSSLNSILYFQELDLGSAYCEDREVISLEELDSHQIGFTLRFIEADDEAFRYGRFIIAPADSIPFQSNTNEKLLPLYRQQKSGFFLTPFTTQLEAFKKMLPNIEEI